jgi:hypothetical protein
MPEARQRSRLAGTVEKVLDSCWNPAVAMRIMRVSLPGRQQGCTAAGAPAKRTAMPVRAAKRGDAATGRRAAGLRPTGPMR